MSHDLIAWVTFNIFVLLMVALDAGVIHRLQRVMRLREAIGWTLVWVALAALFALVLHEHGQSITGNRVLPNGTLALQFVTGYVIELALSVDNLFVFLLVFRYLQVPGALQRRVLTWGVVGAAAMRALFIVAGVTLIRHFEWITYIFGGFIIYVGFRLLFQPKTMLPHDNVVLRAFRRLFPVTSDFEGGKFFTIRDGLRYATPLAVTLLMVETADVLFAVDSIPAVLAISRDAFIVYSSNIFAILGLRSMYFALAGLMDIFYLLHYGLSVVLVFIGVKMLGARYFDISTALSLGIVIGVLACTVLLSLLFPKKKREFSA